MPSTRDNGIQVPINADAYNLTGDLATMADTANVATVCVNQAAMDALTDRNGRLAVRVDLGYALYANDGTNWNAVPLATPFGHMGRIAGNFGLTTTGQTVPMEAAQELRGGMTFENATDSLVVPRSGIYRITMKLYATGAGSSLKHTMSAHKVSSGAISGAGLQCQKVDSGDWFTYGTVSMPLVANDKIFLSAAVSTGTGNTWGTDGYNGTFLELEYLRP